MVTEDEDLPAGVPEDAHSVVLGEAGVHGKPFPAVRENADVSCVENQLRLTEPHGLMGIRPKFANYKELGTAVVEVHGTVAAVTVAIVVLHKQQKAPVIEAEHRRGCHRIEHRVAVIFEA